MEGNPSKKIQIATLHPIPVVFHVSFNMISKVCVIHQESIK